MLKRYILKKSGDSWVLHDQQGALVDSFKTRTDALSGGTLEGSVGVGNVRILKEDGVFEEERTFPRSKDPRRSPG